MLKTVDERAAGTKVDVIFYSDNCGGQNKNKFVASLCSFAVIYFKNINSITHKFLIQGHTQNEGDNVHSLIEKEIKRSLKSGPVYIPQQYVTLIRSAKKHGLPFKVREIDHSFFLNLKKLQEQWGYNFKEDEDRNTVTWNDIKLLKFCKQEPFLFYYKTSYNKEFKIVNVRNKRKKMPGLEDIEVDRAYASKIDLNLNKKKDLKELMKRNLIPNVYHNYYNSLM